jgi:hypothetical protein
MSLSLGEQLLTLRRIIWLLTLKVKSVQSFDT